VIESVSDHVAREAGNPVEGEREGACVLAGAAPVNDARHDGFEVEPVERERKLK
jgi:hypothetical protein